MYKKLLKTTVIALGLAASMHSSANDNETQHDKTEDSGNVVASIEYLLGDKLCKIQSSVAEQIMTHRQQGTSLLQVLELLDTQEYKSIALEAYGTPLYNSDSYQKIAISEFTSQFYLDCHNELVKGLMDKYSE